MKRTFWTSLCVAGLAAAVAIPAPAASACDPKPCDPKPCAPQQPDAKPIKIRNELKLDEITSRDIARLQRRAEEFAKRAAHEGQLAAQEVVNEMIESGELRRITDSALREARYAALAFTDAQELHEQNGDQPALGTLAGQFAREVVEEVLASLNHDQAAVRAAREQLAQLERMAHDEWIHEDEEDELHEHEHELREHEERLHEHEERLHEHAERLHEKEEHLHEQHEELEHLRREIEREHEDAWHEIEREHEEARREFEREHENAWHEIERERAHAEHELDVARMEMEQDIENERRQIERQRDELERERQQLERRIIELEHQLAKKNARRTSLRRTEEFRPVQTDHHDVHVRNEWHDPHDGHNEYVYVWDGQNGSYAVTSPKDAVIRVDKKDGTVHVESDGQHGNGHHQVFTVDGGNVKILEGDGQNPLLVIETDEDGTVRLTDSDGNTQVLDADGDVNVLRTTTTTSRAPRVVRSHSIAKVPGQNPSVNVAKPKLTREVEDEVKNLADDVRALMQAMRSEMDSLRTDMRDLRDEMRNMRSADGGR